MPDISHLLYIETTVEQLYHTISTIEGLSKWWTTHTFGNEMIGGELTFSFPPQQTVSRMIVKELEINKKVVWECVGDFSEWEGTQLTFDIKERENNCVILFTHAKWEAYTPMFAGCNYDWAMYLKSLKDYLETETGAPHS